MGAMATQGLILSAARRATSGHGHGCAALLPAPAAALLPAGAVPIR